MQVIPTSLVHHTMQRNPRTFIAGNRQLTAQKQFAEKLCFCTLKN